MLSHLTKKGKFGAPIEVMYESIRTKQIQTIVRCDLPEAFRLLSDIN